MAEFESWRSYWEFHRTVSRELRFVRTREAEQFLETVLATSAKRRTDFKEGYVFWRSQLGHDWREEGEEGATFEVLRAYPPERMKPLRDRASDGRANPKGIPCLYLATERDTAIAEVRPWIGSHVSVAQFRTLRPLTIIDCSRGHNKMNLYFEEPDVVEREEAVWSSIDRAFAKPITRSDHYADYVPTQIIAELFKREGLDGVAYKSNFGKNGYNIALFDLDAAALLNCTLYEVNKVTMVSEQVDNTYFVKENLGKG
ncbi:RES family NAD+ phosphorylase [Mesorhizobium newzealandense]|uniref:RES family NAD+ phosphorylase n=1 Tax=Mesorhizobium newzealandense TaxID=1300302 RepID=A0ABW4UCE8_9HYPH